MKKALFAVGAMFLLLASGYGGEGGWIAGKVKGKWVEKHQVVVFVQDRTGRNAERPTERPTIDQKDRTFSPHILPVIVGTTVEFKNNDPFKHNIFSPDGERYNLGSWGWGKVKSYTFKKPGVYRQLCNIHLGMLAYIVVLETPYFALTDKEGNFKIVGVPNGKYVIRVWGEKLTKEQLAKTFEVTREEGRPAFVEIDLLR